MKVSRLAQKSLIKERAFAEQWFPKGEQLLCNTVRRVTPENKTHLGNEASSLSNHSIPQLAFAGQPEFLI